MNFSYGTFLFKLSNNWLCFFFCRKPSHVPIIITGDLNTQPYSELYQLITSGNINYVNILKDIWQRHNEESQLISATSSGTY